MADFGLSKSQGEATDNEAFPILWSPPEVATNIFWLFVTFYIMDVPGTQQEGVQFQVWCLVRSSGQLTILLLNKDFSKANMPRSFGITMWEIFSFGEKPYNGMKHNDLKNFLKREERIAVSQVLNIGVNLDSNFKQRFLRPI